ncbi:photosystem II reaction center protein Psb28 [Anthocerotibacter panamensis]|uniref:photosystem II reaction center protein Psb28 n=1 Tax=Anthocerotibacter panamensis TaxID=2857077 RepID=UPI001C405CAF|nr:photosystem II reaction center protein Psb28 [Anthocerotibacter panamensis]
MVATIQFVAGINEEAKDIKIRGFRNSPRKTAIFSFETPRARNTANKIERMRLSDEEGSLDVTDVRAQFLNGEFAGVECVYEMLTEPEFERFMRFMERYAEANGLEFGRQ